MDRLIDLLKEKNHYLESFFAVNEHELSNFSEGEFENVEGFYQAREKILEFIKRIDLKIDLEQKTSTGIITDDFRTEVEACLMVKDEWVTAILQQDLQVISYVENEKSNIIRELSATRQTKRAVTAYAKTELLKQLEEK